MEQFTKEIYEVLRTVIVALALIGWLVLGSSALGAIEARALGKATTSLHSAALSSVGKSPLAHRSCGDEVRYGGIPAGPKVTHHAADFFFRLNSM